MVLKLILVLLLKLVWRDFISFISFIRFDSTLKKFLNDESAQGAAELLLLLGGVLVVVLILVSIYKSYVSDLSLEVSSNELNDLNNSFSDLASKFD